MIQVSETRLNELKKGDVFVIIGDHQNGDKWSGTAAYRIDEIDKRKGTAHCIRLNPAFRKMTGSRDFEFDGNNYGVNFIWRPYDDDDGSCKQFVLKIEASE